MKKALITGATSGIGEGLAKALAKKGYHLLLTGRNEDKLQELKKEIGNVAILSCALENDYHPVLKWIEEEVPDLIINNAGFGLYGDAINHKIEEETAMVRVNCEALLAITLQAARTLRSKGKKGTILNISSSGGYQPFPGFATYVSTKAFVTNLSISLHAEMVDYGIRVLVSCPGRIKTNFSKRAAPGREEKRVPGYIMTLEYGVNRIMEQIETGKKVDIFDWHYQFLVHASRWIPDSIICKMLRKKADLNN